MKTKIIFILFFFIGANLKIAAQKTDSLNNYKWEIGLQINTPERKSPLEEQTENSFNSTWSDEIFLYHANSNNGTTKDKTFSVALVGNYYLKGNNFLKIKTGFSKVDIELTDKPFIESTGTYQAYDNAYKKRNDIILSPGVGRVMGIKNFKFYGGFDIPFTYYGNAHVDYFVQTNDASTGIPVSSYELSGTIFSAYSIGIGNFAGFSFLFKHFSVSGEVSYAFLYNKRLSESTFQSVAKDLQTNTITSSAGITYHPTVSYFDISKIKGSIMLAYSF